MNLRLKLVIFLFSMYCGLLQNSQAQQIQAINGPEYKDPSGTYISQMVGENENGIYAIRFKSSGKDEYFIEKYDKDLKQVFSNLIDFPAPDQKTTYYLQDVLLLNKKFYVFVSRYDKDAEATYLYAGFIEESGKVSQFYELSKIEAKSKRKSGSFNVSISRDSSKIFVQKNERYDREEQERFSISVFDLNFKNIYAKDVVLPYMDKNYDIGKTLVDKDGNIHMFSEVRVPRKDRDKDDPDTYFEVFSYFYKDDVVKQYEISLGENVISGIDIELDDNNNLIGAGFYSEKNEMRMKGTFYFIVDPISRQIKTTSQKEFTKEFLAQFMSENKAEKGTELRNYKIRDIHSRDDGGAVIVAEFYRYRITSYKNPNTGLYETTHRWYFNDLIVTNINPTGKIDWYAKVPKKQMYSSTMYNQTMATRWAMSSSELKYLGISSFVVKDKIYIIFNESPKNLEPDADPDKPKVMGNPRKSITTLVTISADGKMVKTPLFPAKDSKSIVTPKFYLQLSPSSLLMFGDKGTTYRFLKLSF